MKIKYFTGALAGMLLAGIALPIDLPPMYQNGGQGQGQGKKAKSQKKTGPQDGSGPIHTPGTGGGNGGGKQGKRGGRR